MLPHIMLQRKMKQRLQPATSFYILQGGVLVAQAKILTYGTAPKEKSILILLGLVVN